MVAMIFPGEVQCLSGRHRWPSTLRTLICITSHASEHTTFFFRAHYNTNEHFVMNGKPDTRSKTKHSSLCKICSTPRDSYSGVNL